MSRQLRTPETRRQDLRNLFERVLKETDTTQAKLAELLNSKPQTVGEKIRNASWRYIDVVEALNVLGFDLQLVRADEKVAQKSRDYIQFIKLFDIDKLEYVEKEAMFRQIIDDSVDRALKQKGIL